MIARDLALIACLCAVAAATAPVFPASFVAAFNETVWIHPGHDDSIATQQGALYYSWTDTLKAQRVDRARSDLNSLCREVHDTKEPCTQYSLQGGKRFFYFPQRSECCLDQCEGCGMLIPSWIDGASLNRTVTLQGSAGTTATCDIYSKFGATSIDSFGQISAPAALKGNACAIYDGGDPPRNSLMPYLWLFDPDAYRVNATAVSFFLPPPCQNAAPCHN
eukprot:TRINITY_DN27173_c0_g1_i1.p1 TRINITY_DN27173_c0_g1~~TRINITY_DN27173_c0_g1_i1.p1  ORF type:complete len:220 (+),score=15.27 TRINITY_DN27173_c0_g1_i1:18-677(+)